MSSFDDAMYVMSMERISEHKKIDLVLMNKDDVIMYFSYHEENMSDWFEEEEPIGILPIGFTDIQTWLHHRKSPYGRKNMQLLMAYSQCDSLIGYAVLTKCVSLNDTYWVKLREESICWREISPYTNTLNNIIAAFAFDGLSDIQIGSPSPEYSTDGTSPKFWRNNEGTIQLVKGGTKQNNFNEPWLEYYASDVCKFLCDDTVEYFYESFKNRNVSVCNLFTSQETGFSSFSKVFMRNMRQDEVFSEFKKYGSEGLFRAMIIADAITLNVDRHLGNVGYLINNDTQEIQRIAPIFDFNMCLVPTLTEYDYSEEKLSKLADSLVPRLGNDFVKMAQYYLTDDLRIKLQNLYDALNSPTTHWRYSASQYFVRWQILKVLGLNPKGLKLR